SFFRPVCFPPLTGTGKIEEEWTLSGQGIGYCARRSRLAGTLSLPPAFSRPDSGKGAHVALTNVDRDLLKRCLNHKSGAWNDFVDRYLGLIYHVINHTSQARSTPLQPEDVEDLAGEILLQIVSGDYAVLRQFREQCSLATYLTVVA